MIIAIIAIIAINITVMVDMHNRYRHVTDRLPNSLVFLRLPCVPTCA